MTQVANRKKVTPPANVIVELVCGELEEFTGPMVNW